MPSSAVSAWSRTSAPLTAVKDAPCTLRYTCQRVRDENRACPPIVPEMAKPCSPPGNPGNPARRAQSQITAGGHGNDPKKTHARGAQPTTRVREETAPTTTPCPGRSTATALRPTTRIDDPSTTRTKAHYGSKGGVPGAREAAGGARRIRETPRPHRPTTKPSERGQTTPVRPMIFDGTNNQPIDDYGGRRVDTWRGPRPTLASGPRYLRSTHRLLSGLLDTDTLVRGETMAGGAAPPRAEHERVSSTFDSKRCPPAPP